MYKVRYDIKVYYNKGGMKTMTDIYSVEKWFIKNNIDVASSSLDGHYKLQKLLFYSQAMSLVVKNEPLFSNNFEAWPNGPVARQAHFHFKVARIAETLTKKDLENIDNVFSPTELKILQIINFVYGGDSAQDLIDRTHAEKPWYDLKDKAMQKSNPIISMESIKSFYKPLKEVFDSYKNIDLSYMQEISINTNRFMFDKKQTHLSTDDELKLWEIGSQVQNDSFFVYKEESELVVY